MIRAEDLPSDTERVLVPAQPSMEEEPLISNVIRLGEWLVNRSLINRSHLYQGLQLAYQRSCRLGDALVEMGVLQRQRMEQEIQMLHATLDTPGRAVPPPLPADVFRTEDPDTEVETKSGSISTSKTETGTKRKRKGPPPLPADVFKSKSKAAPSLPRSRADDTEKVLSAPRADDTEKDVVYYLTRRKRHE
jgi:hypothetical protein